MRKFSPKRRAFRNNEVKEWALRQQRPTCCGGAKMPPCPDLPADERSVVGASAAQGRNVAELEPDRVCRKVLSNMPRSSG